MSDWLTVQQAAEIPQVSIGVVYRAIKAGKLRAARIGEGRGLLRIHRQWVEDWLTGKPTPRDVAHVNVRSEEVRV